MTDEELLADAGGRATALARQLAADAAASSDPPADALRRAADAAAKLAEALRPTRPPRRDSL